ncbi:ER membrane protein complex subunit 2 [Vanrija pseudolonga]|uniref:ER membrane protein complex subunit 2 n=1 Tax=Vanrija pseudolonga TaxID=143232 RepID=A0AAF0Y717_9TREE|nr:ER membrane protein complex subunit 2 [Vanrija pseudolonga]
MSQADIDQLARWRTLGARNSEDVVRLAPGVLAAGGLGDTEWAVREQLAIAALDLGRIKLATTQINALESQFRASPRVDLLLGLKLEAVGDLERAGKVYSALLKTDATNVSAHQRIIALSATPTETIQRLLAYLDTFYADPAAWSLLAEAYANEGAYAQSLAALGHLQLLQTWDSQAVVRAGETAYTLKDYPLALKYFLRAVEMETPVAGKAEGHRSRAWWGVKLAAKRLLDPKHADTETSLPESERTSEAQLRKLDALATEQLLALGGANLAERRTVLGEAKAKR